MSFDTAAGTATAKLAERLFADSESKIFLRTIPIRPDTAYPHKVVISSL